MPLLLKAFKKRESMQNSIFQQHLDTLINNMDSLPEMLEPAAEILNECILNDRKIFACGNGFGGIVAQTFCQTLLNHLDQERPALPAFCLNDNATTISAISHRYKYNEVYARQIRALGFEGDVLLIIDSEQQYANLNTAIQTAHERGMKVIVIHPYNSQNITTLLSEDDTTITVDCDNPAILLQIEIIVVNALCNLIDQNLFSY